MNAHEPPRALQAAGTVSASRPPESAFVMTFFVPPRPAPRRLPAGTAGQHLAKASALRSLYPLAPLHDANPWYQRHSGHRRHQPPQRLLPAPCGRTLEAADCSNGAGDCPQAGATGCKQMLQKTGKVTGPCLGRQGDHPNGGEGGAELKGPQPVSQARHLNKTRRQPPGALLDTPPVLCAGRPARMAAIAVPRGTRAPWRARIRSSAK